MEFKEKGNFLFKSGEYTEALSVYLEGIDSCDWEKLSPEDKVIPNLESILWCNIALCYKNMEKNEEMLEALNKSIKADPLYEKPLNLRANLNYKLKNW
jgi:tetratricopeptide (TPR) repeat protein